MWRKVACDTMNDVNDLLARWIAAYGNKDFYRGAGEYDDRIYYGIVKGD
jgi:hypothetical protein